MGLKVTLVPHWHHLGIFSIDARGDNCWMAALERDFAHAFAMRGSALRIHLNIALQGYVLLGCWQTEGLWESLVLVH